MLPAHQCLGADNLAIGIHLRLQVELQLVGTYGLTQLTLDEEALACDLLHVGFEEGGLVTSAFLGSMQCGIRPTQDIVRGIMLQLGEQGHAQADGNRYIFHAAAERLLHRMMNLFDYYVRMTAGDMCRSVQVLQKNGELVSGHPRQRVVLAQDARQAVSNRFQ